jgi:hypothetical protein
VNRFNRAVKVIGTWFDLRDVFAFGGLALMGYGLYLFQPWIAYAICGAALSAIGLFKGRGAMNGNP